jgi:tetratricopeptide (TPR) repeat protein
MRQRLLVASSGLALLCLTVVAAAQQPPPASPPPPSPAATAAPPAPAAAPAASPAATPAAAPAATSPRRPGSSPYNPKIQKGIGLYAARDYAGAAVAFKDDIAAEPAAPLPYYLLAEAQIAAGSLADADASLQAGLARADTNDNVKCKILFVLADLRERQGNLENARKAWEQYAQFVASHPASNGYIATATERIRVIDQHFELDKKYAPVRQRIEQRLKETGGAAPAGSSAAPAPSSAPADGLK